jgi:hydrogenase nickel incorporation protein HypA/HybF
MHEAGLMQTALDMAFDQARIAGATRIHQVRLRVGQLSGVVPNALRMAFAAAIPGTAADGAELIVDEIAVRCQCEECGEEYCPEDVVYLCSNCGAINSLIQAGRELELASLEVS